MKALETSQKNEGKKLKDVNVQNDSSNKSFPNNPQKIKILQRNEKLEDIAKEFQVDDPMKFWMTYSYIIVFIFRNLQRKKKVLGIYA